jgi:glycosyltransferase involved in cell wall biosynthesis
MNGANGHPNRPTIAFNAFALRPDGAGVSTYIRELLRELPPLVDADWVAGVHEDAVGELPPGITPRPTPVAAGLRRAIDGLRSPGEVALVHGLDVDLPLRPGAPTVTTVQDLSVFDVPWAFSRRKAIAERLIFRRAVRRADAVVASSSFTAERVKARLGRDAVVIPLAPSSDMAPPSHDDVEAVRRRYDLPPRFVLHVGTIEPRKDVHGAAAACREAGIPLVLVGAVRPDRTVPDGARALGFVPRHELPAMYGAATVVAYCSRYEGFGLPPVEAMACGAPVVATRVASLPEVLADGAVLVRPGDTNELASVLRDLVADDERRRELAAAGHRRAATMSWTATARATADVYRSLGIGQ